MSQGDHRRRHPLTIEEHSRGVMGGVVRDAIRQPGRQQSCNSGDERCHQGRQDDLAHDLAGMDAAHASLDEDGTDEATEESMGGAGRQTEQPGREVPDDRADQTGEDHRGCDELVIDDATGDRLGDLGRQAGTNDVEDGRNDDGHLGLECSGCHRRRHRVGRVMEAVGEVECQRRHDDDNHD